MLSHRFAWETTYGPIDEGVLVCHHCDNRKCVEPTHLFLGSYTDNNNDMFTKGRGHVFDGSHIVGEKNPQAKMTLHDAEKAKGMFNAGASLGYVAKNFGISKQAAKCIRDGITWQHAIAREISPIEPMRLERPSGEANIKARMTWGAVKALRGDRAAGAKVKELAEKFSISASTVKQILSGKTWKEQAAAKAGSSALAQINGTAKCR